MGVVTLLPVILAHHPFWYLWASRNVTHTSLRPKQESINSCAINTFVSVKWSCPTHAFVKKTKTKQKQSMLISQMDKLSLEPGAPAEGATLHWSGDAETASELTNKERKSEEVFSRNTRPAARLSLRKPQPKFPSKTLFTAGSKVGQERRGGRWRSNNSLQNRLLYLLSFSRGRWNGNRSWGEMTWEGGDKEVVQNRK